MTGRHFKNFLMAGTLLSTALTLSTIQDAQASTRYYHGSGGKPSVEVNLDVLNDSAYAPAPAAPAYANTIDSIPLEAPRGFENPNDMRGGMPVPLVRSAPLPAPVNTAPFPVAAPAMEETLIISSDPTSHSRIKKEYIPAPAPRPVARPAPVAIENDIIEHSLTHVGLPAAHAPIEPARNVNNHPSPVMAPSFVTPAMPVTVPVIAPAAPRPSFLDVIENSVDRLAGPDHTPGPSASLNFPAVPAAPLPMPAAPAQQLSPSPSSDILMPMPSVEQARIQAAEPYPPVIEAQMARPRTFEAPSLAPAMPAAPVAPPSPVIAWNDPPARPAEKAIDITVMPPVAAPIAPPAELAAPENVTTVTTVAATQPPMDAAPPLYKNDFFTSDTPIDSIAPALSKPAEKRPPEKILKVTDVTRRTEIEPETAGPVEKPADFEVEQRVAAEMPGLSVPQMPQDAPGAPQPPVKALVATAPETREKPQAGNNNGLAHSGMNDLFTLSEPRPIEFESERLQIASLAHKKDDNIADIAPVPPVVTSFAPIAADRGGILSSPLHQLPPKEEIVSVETINISDNPAPLAGLVSAPTGQDINAPALNIAPMIDAMKAKSNHSPSYGDALAPARVNEIAMLEPATPLPVTAQALPQLPPATVAAPLPPAAQTIQGTGNENVTSHISEKLEINETESAVEIIETTETTDISTGTTGPKIAPENNLPPQVLNVKTPPPAFGTDAYETATPLKNLQEFEARAPIENDAEVAVNPVPVKDVETTEIQTSDVIVTETVVEKAPIIEPAENTAPHISAPPIQQELPFPEQAAAIPQENSEAAPADMSFKMAALPALSDMSLVFSGAEKELSPALTAQLADVVTRLKSDPAKRLQLRSYAASLDGSQSSSRRIALARAIEVRAHLMDQGIDSTRIDVRALGDQTDKTPVNRMDMVLTN